MLTGFVVATLFAYFLYKKIFMNKLFSVIFMLPQIVSSVIMVAIYKNLVGTNGPLDKLYTLFSGEKMAPLLYTEGGVATWAIVIYCIWTGFGMNLILFSGAMAKIPPEVIESANLEGVGFMREFFAIELPLIWPTLSIMLLLSANGIFMASGPIILFTDGMYETQTISYWFYKAVILDNDYNIASAFGLMLTAAGAPLSLLVLYIRNKISTDVTY